MLNSSIAASFQRAPVHVAGPSLEDRIQALLQDAGRWHQQGELVLARSLYLDILALSGEQAQALFLLSLVSFQLGDWGSAKHGLNQYLKQHSQDLTAWGLLGQCLLALGEHANAVEIFKNLGYLEPDHVEHVTELARAYRAWGGAHGDLAREALHQAHLRSPHHEKVLSALSELYMEQQGFDLALPLLQELCEMDPLNAQYRLNLGLVHQGLGQNPQAQSNYAKAIELDAAMPAAHYNWGVLLQDEGKDDLAIEQYRCALRLDPRYAAVYLNLSVLLCQTPSYNEALQLLDEALLHGVQSDSVARSKRWRILKKPLTSTPRMPKRTGIWGSIVCVWACLSGAGLSTSGDGKSTASSPWPCPLQNPDGQTRAASQPIKGSWFGPNKVWVTRSCSPHFCPKHASGCSISWCKSIDGFLK